ncbi:NADPH-dependent FMN reductase [Lichenifustis flavocetrariae]|uniref:NAD(P)H-dependent oxidoreductase n=1 Tax=Lichenifustis flavocetrariae TaxID=2949735 RepID=A0AA41YZZ0_9HYPH|nr:NADPH-dependent FMN reductase [Lichenifustis flavocetrariae]MCW6510342.1 NAD(P)H-dependent oxidoreductase [Lichenifustis flavocetrariae]
MPARPLSFLGLSGSLRGASTNTALLEAARLLAPPDLRVDVYNGLGDLPLFNPDLDEPGRPPPAAVAAFRSAVDTCDGLLVACPEYAHGVPGAFKNALDWLVGGPEFPGKPIALFHATTRGTHVRAALTEILSTMSGLIVQGATLALPLLGRHESPQTIATNADHAREIGSALRFFASCVRSIPAR